MKRKLLAVFTLFASLTLVTACGGSTNNNEPSWQSDKTYHWKEDEEGEKVEKAKHTMVKVDAECVEATCEAPGKTVKACSVCGYRTEETIAQKEHNIVNDGDATGKVHPEKCSNGCNLKAYRFDISEAEGWNKDTTKWNAKTTDSSNNQVEALWTLEAGQLPAGDYEVYLEATMSRDSHSSRYLFNENKEVNPKKPDGTDFPDQSSSSPDGANESKWRYYFAVNGVDVFPDTSKTLGEIGYSGGDGATPAFGLVLSKITIPADVTSFSAKHGDIGYSLIVSRVRLVEIKAAA